MRPDSLLVAIHRNVISNSFTPDNKDVGFNHNMCHTIIFVKTEAVNGRRGVSEEAQTPRGCTQ